MKRLAACVLIATIVGVSARSVSLAEVAAETCVPREARVLASSAEASVYRVSVRKRRRGYEVFACVRGSRQRPVQIADGDFDFVFGGPALSLNGTVLGYALDICDFSAGGDGCRTEVHVEDLADEGRSRQLGFSAAGPLSYRPVKVGSLRARPNGDVAWIACPEFASDTDIVGERGPTCVRPGNTDRVYALDAQSGRRSRLDLSKRIDPGSLRREGSRVSWIRAGHRRSGSLR